MNVQTFVTSIRSALQMIVQDVSSPHGDFDESAFQAFCGRVDELLLAEIDSWRRAKIAELAKTFGYVEQHGSPWSGASQEIDEVEIGKAIMEGTW